MRNKIYKNVINNFNSFHASLKSARGRNEVSQNPWFYLAQYGINIPQTVDIILATDKPDVQNFVIPQRNERELATEESQYIYAAVASLSSAGTMSSVGTFGSLISCAVSASTGLCTSSLGSINVHH